MICSCFARGYPLGTHARQCELPFPGMVFGCRCERARDDGRHFYDCDAYYPNGVPKGEDDNAVQMQWLRLFARATATARCTTDCTTDCGNCKGSGPLKEPEMSHTAHCSGCDFHVVSTDWQALKAQAQGHDSLGHRVQVWPTAVTVAPLPRELWAA